MYLLGSEVTLDWVLSETPLTVLLSDLDLVIIDPEGTSTYLDAPIDISLFIPPTVTTVGSVSYLFTPNKEGLYKIRLVKGTADSYTVLSKMEMYILDNTTVVSPYSPEIGKPVPYDVCYFMQGYMVATEIVGSYAATRDVVFAANSIRNIAIAEVAPNTVDQLFSIKHEGVVIGTITFTVNSKIGVVVMNELLLSKNERLQITVNPGSVDYAIRDVSVTLVGCTSISSCELL